MQHSASPEPTIGFVPEQPLARADQPTPGGDNARRIRLRPTTESRLGDPSAARFRVRRRGSRRVVLRRFLNATKASLPALMILGMAAPLCSLAQPALPPARVVTGGRALPARTTPTDSSAKAAPLAPAADPCKAALDELTALRLEAAGKVREIERVRLLDPGLGAVMQTSLSDLNTRIKIAETAVARCDERDRERRDDEKLRAIQAHELRMVDQQHRHQKELLQYQQELARPALGPEPPEKDFFDLWADGLDASARLNQGVRQLRSTDAQVQADGLRNVGGAVRQMTPRK